MKIAGGGSGDEVIVLAWTELKRVGSGRERPEIKRGEKIVIDGLSDCNSIVYRMYVSFFNT